MMTVRDKISNKGVAFGTVAFVAVAAGLIMAGKGCGPRAQSHCPKPTPMVETIRPNDGICHQKERDPYLTNADGTVMKAKDGKPVRNPLYSKADCYKGDGVCDNGASIADLKDPEGNSVDALSLRIKGGKLTYSYMDKPEQGLVLPLENEDSYDCMIAEAIKEPCQDREYGKPPTLKRKTFSPKTGETLIDPQTPLVQRSMSEMLSIWKNATLVKPGDNYFVTIAGYNESGDCNNSELPLCDPKIPILCKCPSSPTCKPTAPPKTCGNGKLDNGEQGDPSYKGKPRGGCDQGYHPTKSCKCEKDAVVIEDMTPDPAPRCGDGKVNQKSEECDPPGSAAGEGSKGKCNAQCKIEMPKPEPKTDLESCKSDRSVTALKQTLQRYIDGKAMMFSKRYTHSGTAVVRVSLRIVIDADGKAESYSVDSSCKGGGDSGCPKTRLSASENRSALGPLNTGDLSIDSQGDRCVVRVQRVIAQSGN
jgi:hypothetical protein